MAVTGALAGALAVNGRTMGASVVAATLMAAGVDCARAGPAQVTNGAFSGGESHHVDALFQFVAPRELSGRRTAHARGVKLFLASTVTSSPDDSQAQHYEFIS